MYVATSLPQPHMGTNKTGCWRGVAIIESLNVQYRIQPNYCTLHLAFFKITRKTCGKIGIYLY